MAEKDELKDILSRYKGRISEYVEAEGEASQEELKQFSREYQQFRREALSKGESRYERWCVRAENILKFRPSKKDIPALQDAITTAHLNITPTGATSLAVLVAFLFVMAGLLYGFVVFAITSNFFADFAAGRIPLFFPFIFLIMGVVALRIMSRMPITIAARWRLRASNQMVLCILYVVIYMRHTPNLENAIKFATDHIGPPLSVDLRKVFWDIETRKFSTIKESLDHYLQNWRHHNLEFVTSFHLIESSLYEPTDARRLELLDKALDVMLEGTYEKMLRYAQDLKNPITTLHLLGVILPILGLVIFPLVGSFLGGLVRWYHLAFLYNLILPVVVYSYGMSLLSRRPTGYGESRFAEAAYKPAFNPFWLCVFIAGLFLVVGFFPVILHLIDPTPGLGPGNCAPNDLDLGILGCFLDYQEGSGGQAFGPFGLGAMVLSFFIPFGLALSFGLYYRIQTRKVLELRNETKNLEKEYASALFQLGNRIGDGVPAELAFNKVATTLEGTPAGNFFKAVDTNIRSVGMSLKEAIFNPKRGAVLAYPSPLVESSMEILVESARKGPKIASRSLLTIATYVESINKVNERLRDLMTEIVSSIKSQLSFLTPAIAGIVVGISVMIVSIIVSLNTRFAQFGAEGGVEGLGTEGLSVLTNIFGIDGIIPGFYFQLVVGLYVVQLTYILTKLQNGVENGEDPVMEKYLLGKNMYKSVFLYVIISVIVTILFYILATRIAGPQGF